MDHPNRSSEDCSAKSNVDDTHWSHEASERKNISNCDILTKNLVSLTSSSKNFFEAKLKSNGLISLIGKIWGKPNIYHGY